MRRNWCVAILTLSTIYPPLSLFSQSLSFGFSLAFPLYIHDIHDCLFTPQKVTIDVCKIYGEDTVFLQQAAHLTGGSYIYLERRDALLQYLIVRPSLPLLATPC